MEEICLENSTQCLLRALLDAQPAYDWGPLSFAFTAAIGILAFLVAVATVFQGMLGAGPGRVKASSAAIGTWSKKTRTRFDWYELRLRTTAKVPYISEIKDLKVHWGSDRVFSKSFPARWLTLVDSAGVTVSEEDCEEVEIDTDHLPSDILAAPAWITVRMAVIMAALAGCDNVTMSEYSPYPIVSGKNAQLRFREHPDLGSIAVFDLLRKKRVYALGIGTDLISESNIGLLDSSLRRGGYSVHEMEKIEKDLNAITSGCGHAQCAKPFKSSIGLEKAGRLLVPIIAESPQSPRAIALKIGRHLEILQNLVSQCPVWHTSSQAKNVVEALSALGRINHPLLDEYSWRTSEQPIEDESKFRRVFKLGWSWLGKPPTITTDSAWFTRKPLLGNNLSILKAVVELCFRVAKGDIRAIKSLHDARLYLQVQLHELDCWLLHSGGALVGCETRALVEDTAKLSQMMDMPSADIDIAADTSGTYEMEAPNVDDNILPVQTDPVPTSPRPNVSSDPAQTQESQLDSVPTPLLTTISGSSPANGVLAVPRSLHQRVVPDAELSAESSAASPRQPHLQIPSYNPAIAQARWASSVDTYSPPVSPAVSVAVLATEQNLSEEAAVDVERKRRAMRALLVYRAALWTTYIHTAADVSCVYESDIGDRIIQIL
jgi:hypothetical protein